MQVYNNIKITDEKIIDAKVVSGEDDRLYVGDKLILTDDGNGETLSDKDGNRYAAAYEVDDSYKLDDPATYEGGWIPIGHVRL